MSGSILTTCSPLPELGCGCRPSSILFPLIVSLEIDYQGKRKKIIPIPGERIGDSPEVKSNGLLYERYLGRPFAAHRDAVSELVGEVMGNAIEDCLRTNGVTYRITQRAEKIPGFGQTPEFCIPDEPVTKSPALKCLRPNAVNTSTWSMRV